MLWSEAACSRHLVALGPSAPPGPTCRPSAPSVQSASWWRHVDFRQRLTGRGSRGRGDAAGKGRGYCLTDQGVWLYNSHQGCEVGCSFIQPQESDSSNHSAHRHLWADLCFLRQVCRRFRPTHTTYGGSVEPSGGGRVESSSCWQMFLMSLTDSCET